MKKAFASLLFLLLAFQILFMIKPHQRLYTLEALRAQKVFYDTIHFNAVAEERAVIGAFVGLSLYLSRPDVMWQEALSFVLESPDNLKDFFTHPSVVEVLEEAMEVGSEGALLSLSNRAPFYDPLLASSSEKDDMALCGIPSPDQHIASAEASKEGRATLFITPLCRDLVEVNLRLDPSSLVSVDPHHLNIEDLLRNGEITIHIAKGSTLMYVSAYQGVAGTGELLPREVSITFDHIFTSTMEDIQSLPLPPFFQHVEEGIEDLPPLEEGYPLPSP